jgi:hypothetical protein
MSLPQLPQVDRDQAINDMIEAMALQEAALASLIHAEAAKIDGLTAAGIPAAADTDKVESFQAAVTAVLQATAEKQQSITAKLDMLRAIITAGVTK